MEDVNSKSYKIKGLVNVKNQDYDVKYDFIKNTLLILIRTNYTVHI